jgi:hypothetical protein
MGFSNQKNINRAYQAGKAGLIITAVGVVLTAISYTNFAHKACWCECDENQTDSREFIQKTIDDAASSGCWPDIKK